MTTTMAFVRAPFQSKLDRWWIDTKTRPLSFSSADVLFLLFIPMWHEASRLLRDGVVDSLDTVDLAMAGGLGFSGDQSWCRFFTDLGDDAIEAAGKKWGSTFRAMTA